MNLTELWNSRKKKHQKKMLKYLKYVLNDHLVIVVVFLLGALGYSYSNALKEISQDFTIGLWTAILCLTISLFLGRLSTLMESADMVFLLQKENELGSYLKKAKKHSLVLPTFFIGAVSALFMPLLVVVQNDSFSDWILFFFYLVILKIVELDLQEVTLKTIGEKKKKAQTGIVFFIFLMINSIAIFYSPWLAIISAVVLYFIELSYAKWLKEKTIYQWELIIDKEEARMKRLLQFFNLFTDIPALKSSIKRRAYFDGPLKWIKIKHANTFFYLFIRAFIRGTEYSGLFIRLTFIGMLVIAWLPQFMIKIAVLIFFMYITGLQIVPLYYHFDNQLLTSLYPINKSMKKTALKKTVFLLLIIQVSLFFFSSLYQADLIKSLLLLSGGILFASLFSLYYIPSRLKR